MELFALDGNTEKSEKAALAAETPAAVESAAEPEAQKTGAEPEVKTGEAAAPEMQEEAAALEVQEEAAAPEVHGGIITTSGVFCNTCGIATFGASCNTRAGAGGSRT